MFGWFRKRPRPEANHDAGSAGPTPDAPKAAPQTTPPAASPAAAPAASPAPSPAPAPAPRAIERASSTPSTPQPRAPRGNAAPSLRPAMPLSDHPNFAGLGLAQPDDAAPRLLEPAAALSPEAREELTSLLLDMFGPSGRYRLEWRTDRTPGDDAMFSQIMVADLVRRIQNSIAVASDLELRAAPLREALEAAFADRADSDTPSAEEFEADETERERAIDAFLRGTESLEDLNVAVHPQAQHRPRDERRIA